MLALTRACYRGPVRKPALIWLVLAAVIFLAYSNGANDNFKGVATIYGSGSASYRAALTWATVAQMAGSLLAIMLAAGLIQTFSAKDLVPDSVASSPTFVAAVAFSATATLLLATALGLPISTTHALTGGLIGAGLVAVGVSGVHFAVLGKSFVLPLLLSPVLAMAMTVTLYPLARLSRHAMGIARESCVCVGTALVPLRPPSAGGAAAGGTALSISTGAAPACVERYQGTVMGISAQSLLEGLHFLSAGAICFARGLNDTPKILALCLSAKAVGAPFGLPLVGVSMALGGLLNARKVAETMSKKITPLNAGQGFIANLTTAALVIAASRAGLPVSTTHVATSGIFGIAVVNRTARTRAVVSILMAWMTTLPLAAVLASLAYAIIRRL
jgi:PiT family inorganic phosphate transporter